MEYRVAPPTVLSTNLPMLKRAFLVLRDCNRSRDEAGVLFANNLAEFFHNVPASLLHHDEARRGSWQEGWMENVRPVRGFRRSAPARFHPLCDFVFGVPESIGSDLSVSDSPDLAPETKCILYLEMMSFGFLSMRGLRWRSSVPKRFRDYGPVCAQLADVLHVLPDALLHWRSFDEGHFWDEARACRRLIPRKHREWWDGFFRDPASFHAVSA